MATITLSGNALTAIVELENRLEDMSPAFKDIADHELSETKLRYVKQQDPEGTPWPDPITIRRDGGGGANTAFTDPWAYVVASNFHAAPPGYHFFDRGRGDKVLRDTGTLFNSISRAYGSDFAVVGTNIEYAQKLQSGRFPFLGINAKTEENVLKVVEFYLVGSNAK